MNDRQTTVKPSPRLGKAWARPITMMESIEYRQIVDNRYSPMARARVLE